MFGFQVVSLYNSAVHRAYYCDEDVCVKRAIGSAGSVFCRSVVRGILDSLPLDSKGVVKVGGGDGFDWGFSRYFEKHHLPVFALNASQAAHFGRFGSWGSSSVRTIPWRTLACATHGFFNLTSLTSCVVWDIYIGCGAGIELRLGWRTGAHPAPCPRVHRARRTGWMNSQNRLETATVRTQERRSLSWSRFPYPS